MPTEHPPHNALKFEVFDPATFLEEVQAPQSVAYLRSYLSDLCARSVVVENCYFDQDHLDAVSGYYSVCARGYLNHCQRVHIFSCAVSRAELFLAASGHPGKAEMCRQLQDGYLGFIVIRPLVPPALGRTVLAEYPNASREGMGLRESECARNYDVHLAGIPFRVKGLAWQQQDRAVSSCAIVALWTMLHGFDSDESRNIPTTTDIARRIHGLSWRARVQPTPGLNNDEVAQVIRAFDFTPFVIEGDAREHTSRRSAFSIGRFSSICATLLRSGYPVLMACTSEHLRDGKLEMTGRHAICATGFRLGAHETGALTEFRDQALRYLYVHDDNWGPNVRFRVATTRNEGRSVAVLELEPPAPRGDSGDDDDGRKLAREYNKKLIPTTLFVAVPSRMRVQPEALYTVGLEVLGQLAKIIQEISPGDTVDLSTRYIGVREYMRDELARVTKQLEGDDLAEIRLALTERVAPLSLYLGLIRFGVRSAGKLTPVFDILYDTTEGGRAMRALATVAFTTEMCRVLVRAVEDNAVDLGILVGPSRGR